ncbi:PREDICTED: uncharacterized protein LOC105966804 [Erythranthe guttata]|uniref:uncharacterized protein LOC105966804 n=1 Tax=Erythranthe guttata TaxID=4155 RepID=UPI00064DB51B|nr:PREDICTED: uncharacterized protein LOC105966804 [Erythranthe guttata]|eukprot:XP_012846837.1 PREDICTED: uncharacterized protein LOC105966804 [Erythranthe guttata]
MVDWFANMSKLTDTGGFEMCMTVCWAIWFYRNRFLFEDKEVDALTTISLAQKFMNQLRQPSARVLSNQALRVTSDSRWLLPSTGVIKINFDAAVNANDGLVGVGIIARDHCGGCVGWMSICIHQPLDPTSAEAKAALLAVELARDKAWRKVVIEGDSTVVIKAIEGKDDDRSLYGNLIADIHAIIPCFEVFSALHIRRNGNGAAHA